MRFGYPWLLVLLALVPVLGIAASFLRLRREKALVRITACPPKTPLAWLQALLLMAGLALVVVAASRPQWGVEAFSQTRRSRNVVVVLDVSRSMRAKDVYPDRLRRAKSDIADLVDALVAEDDDGRIVRDLCALVAFRSDAKTVCPLTDDQAYLKEMLKTIDENSASPGETSLGAGVEKALALIRAEDGGGEAKSDHSAIILVSDGGDLANWAVSSAERARKMGVPVFTVGIGDPQKGATIPLEDGGTVRDAQGNEVVVKLDDAAMKAIAEKSGGRYVRFATAQTTDTSLGDIYRDFLRQVAVKEQNEAGEHLGERYQWFLVPGVVLLLAGAMLSRGRFRLNTKRR